MRNNDTAQTTSGLLRVLIVEDSEADTELLLDVLRRDGYDVLHERVDNAQTLKSALETLQWDIILSDYSLPGFRAPDALSVAQAMGIDLPFIVVSGTVGEEAAAAVMKAGAHDIVLKDNLARLVPAIQRELGEAENRRKRRWVEDQLRQSEERFAKAFRSSPAGMTISLPDGLFLDANDRALALFGFERAEVIGRTSFELNIWVHPEDRLKVQELLRESQSAREIEIECRTKAGDIRNVLASFDSIELGDETCVLTLFQDITERKRAEEALRHSQAAEREQRILAEALREANAALNSTLDLNEILDRILVQVERVLPYDAANVMLIEEDDVVFARGRDYEERGGWETLVHQRVPIRSIPTFLAMIQSQEPLVVPDVQDDAGWVTFPETPWIRSTISAPIRSGGRVVGILNIDSATANAFTAAHLGLLQAFIDQASIAIQNAQLYEQARQQNDELEARVSRRTEALRHAHERLEFLFKATPAIVYRTDPANPLSTTFLTPNVFEQSGYTPEDYAANPEEFWVSRVHPEDLPRVLVERETLATQPHKILEYRVLHSDGGYRWVRDEFKLIRGADDVVEVLGLVVDITERKAVETELRQALTKQQELNALKSRFTSLVSHEFRTPLAVIQAASDILVRYEQRLTVERKQEQLAEIQDQVRHLVSLLDEVLAISQADTVSVKFQPIETDLQALVADLVAEVQSTTMNHRIHWAVHGEVRPVLIDAELMKRALGNLLTNAVKYSLPGTEVTLDVAYGSEQITLQVQDQGIGIPSEDQEKLFEVFYRASNVGNVGGTGLGLAIVKQAVDAHSGSIALASQVGVGTTVTITLPVVVSK